MTEAEKEAELQRIRGNEQSFRRGASHAAETIYGLAEAQRGNGEAAIIAAVEDMAEKILKWREDRGPQPF